jgi:hypothetical protein
MPIRHVGVDQLAAQVDARPVIVDGFRVAARPRQHEADLGIGDR